MTILPRVYGESGAVAYRLPPARTTLGEWGPAEEKRHFPQPLAQKAEVRLQWDGFHCALKLAWIC